MAPLRHQEQAEGISFEKDVESKFHISYGPELARPLAPKPWLCRDLRIAPGAPLIFGGAGYSGKTMAAQAFALAVATGRKLWGKFDVRKGEVLHFDWEQNELTVRRYQRMARDLGIDLADLGRMLGASMIPSTTLDHNGTGWAERALAYLCKGKALCVLDSLRQAFENVDENSSSSVATAMKMLARVSYATGCVVLLIAHSRKATDDTASLRSSLRGSGAVFDQADTVYMLKGEKGKPVYIENVKERHTGREIERFGLRTINVSGPNVGDDPYVTDDIDPEWGLRVEYVSDPEMQAEYTSVDRDDNSIAINAERIASVGMRALEILTRAPDGLTMPTLRGVCGVRPTDVAAAIPMLISSGAVWVDGTGPTAVYRAIPRTREPGEDG